MTNTNKTISRVVIYYTDGTYQEVGNDNTYKPTAPNAPYPNYPSPPLNPNQPFMPKVYPYMPPTYPPGVPPTWTSPFTYSVPNHKTFGTVNDATCGAGFIDTKNRNEAKGKSNE